MREESLGHRRGMGLRARTPGVGEAPLTPAPKGSQI
jgi:hypothetical protein